MTAEILVFEDGSAHRVLSCSCLACWAVRSGFNREVRRLLLRAGATPPGGRR